MMKKVKLFIGIIAFFTATVSCAFSENQKTSETEVCFREHCFHVEVARNRPDQEKGLMNRYSLSPDSGMLFVYEDEGLRSFWMKNVRFPLDMIWLNDQKRVVGIEESAPPCTKEPCEYFYAKQPSSYVLELNQGAVSRMQLNLGDKMEFLA